MLPCWPLCLSLVRDEGYYTKAIPKCQPLFSSFFRGFFLRLSAPAFVPYFVPESVAFSPFMPRISPEPCRSIFSVPLSFLQNINFLLLYFPFTCKLYEKTLLLSFTNQLLGFIMYLGVISAPVGAELLPPRCSDPYIMISGGEL